MILSNEPSPIETTSYNYFWFQEIKQIENSGKFDDEEIKIAVDKNFNYNNNLSNSNYDELSTEPPSGNAKKKEPIFEIIKQPKSSIGNKNIKKGRRNKNGFCNIKAQNDKNTKGNIRNKIKNHFVEDTRFYLNLKLVPYGYILISKKDLSKNRLEDDKLLLQKKIKEFFSEELTGKYKGKKDRNKKIINKIIEEDKDIELINFLNKTLKEAYQDYIHKENIIPEYNFENDLNKIREKYVNDEKYVELYKNVGIHFIDYVEKKGRDSRNSKINN
jgi:hypothetical protein